MGPRLRRVYHWRVRPLNDQLPKEATRGNLATSEVGFPKVLIQRDVDRCQKVLNSRLVMETCEEEMIWASDPLDAEVGWGSHLGFETIGAVWTHYYCVKYNLVSASVRVRV